MWRTSLVFPLICLMSLSLQAQTFRPRNQTSSSPKTQGTLNSSQDQPTKSASVSQDLLNLYSQTTSVRNESDLTAIARATAKVLADTKRSKADRDYASSLLAWALNRRGEMRSEQAALLVGNGQADRAADLDGQAADDFATSVEYAPNNWRHRHNYAIALAMKGEYSKAISQLDQAIQLNPQYANARFNRGELNFETGNYKAAEQDYSAAIQLSQDAQYYNSRAHCRFIMEDYAAALADYNHAVKLESDNAAYQTDLGDACQFVGKWEEAAKAYRAAVSADNKYARAYQNAAWLMSTCPDQRLRNQDLAMSAAKKALDLSGSRTPEVVETLAAATAAAGKYKEAVKLQEEAVQMAVKQKLEDKQIVEFKQRLEVYRSGKAYIQPEPEITENAPTRTASR